MWDGVVPVAAYVVKGFLTELLFYIPFVFAGVVAVIALVNRRSALGGTCVSPAAFNIASSVSSARTKVEVKAQSTRVPL